MPLSAVTLPAAAQAAAQGGASIPLVHAVVLGIVQGLTEFFPVSSSGHLILVPWLVSWEGVRSDTDLSKTFDVALHLGTFVGAAGYFAPDLARLAKAGIASIRRRRIQTADERTAWLLLLSSLPGAAVGASLENLIEERLGEEWLIAIVLIVFGLILAAADRLPGKRTADEFGFRDAATMGVLQAMALSPGVSRSGVTISGARWLGFKRDAAARLSFLMSLPIIGGAAVYKGVKVLAEGGLPAGTESAFLAGMLTSAVTGGLAVWGTLRYVRNHSFTPFVVYRVLLGAVVLALIATGVR
ncbi:MAG: undecaprenyl-diphosphate phosphatase [Actinomycetota bacterium]|nr:undecaprenyl-diphosphate phosphatase [Actinomycetota bacterium]